MKRRVWIALACLAALASRAPAQTVLKVPTGRPPLVDGQLDDGEWRDALATDSPGLARFYAKQSDGYVWLAVELTSSTDGAIDLYLSPEDGRIYDLHASAKLGERELHSGTWPEWKWWTNEGWTANVSRVDSFEQRTFLPTRVREFQIRHARFPGAHWKVMFEILTPAQPEWHVTSYPLHAVNTNTKDWLTLDLGKP